MTYAERIAHDLEPLDMAQEAVLAKALKEMEATSSTIADREIKLREKLRGELEREVDAMKPGRAGVPGDAAGLEKTKELVRGLL